MSPMPVPNPALTAMSEPPGDPAACSAIVSRVASSSPGVRHPLARLGEAAGIRRISAAETRNDAASPT